MFSVVVFSNCWLADINLKCWKNNFGKVQTSYYAILPIPENEWICLRNEKKLTSLCTNKQKGSESSCTTTKVQKKLWHFFLLRTPNWSQNKQPQWRILQTWEQICMERERERERELQMLLYPFPKQSSAFKDHGMREGLELQMIVYLFPKQISAFQEHSLREV